MNKLKQANIFLLASGFILGVVSTIIVAKIYPALFMNSPKSIQNEIQLSEQNIIKDIHKKQRDINKHFNYLFGDIFSSEEKPFESLKELREKMKRNLKDDLKQNNDENENLFSPLFDSWFEYKFGGGTVEDIKQREDSDNIYYDIYIDDLKSKSITTSIENGYITITGELNKNLGEDNFNESDHNYFEYSFRRTFPVPNNVDESNMTTSISGNTATLKLPKIKN